MSVLVVDIGTSAVRSSLVHDDARVEVVAHLDFGPSHPSPGVVELDGRRIAGAVLAAAAAAIGRGHVEVVGIAAQRASTLLWDRASGVLVGAGIGWQDLRTTGHCIRLRQEGHRIAPNQSATKLSYLLDRYDPGREADLCFGTIETWAAWTLSGGGLHVTDATNAAVTGLVLEDGSGWDPDRLEALRIDPRVLPEIVDSMGLLGEAAALEGAPLIGALVGDQQASLIGQGCVRAGQAKVTFGTGGMLDCSTGDVRPPFPVRGDAGTFPIVTRQEAGQRSWGVEAIMLSAGSCVEWLRSGLGLIGAVADSDGIAGSVPDAGGALFVPALGGIGTPLWDFGARGMLLGLDASTDRAQVVRAVLEGIAHRGADLLEAVEADTGLRVEALKMDGGMSANATFVQLVADAIGRPIELASLLEATTLGAGVLGGLAIGTWGSLEDAVRLLKPRAVVEPRRRPDRQRWLDARERARRTVPFLSSLDF